MLHSFCGDSNKFWIQPNSKDIVWKICNLVADQLFADLLVISGVSSDGNKNKIWKKWLNVYIYTGRTDPNNTKISHLGEGGFLFFFFIFFISWGYST